MKGLWGLLTADVIPTAQLKSQYAEHQASGSRPAVAAKPSHTATNQPRSGSLQDEEGTWPPISDEHLAANPTELRRPSFWALSRLASPPATGTGYVARPPAGNVATTSTDELMTWASNALSASSQSSPPPSSPPSSTGMAAPAAAPGRLTSAVPADIRLDARSTAPSGVEAGTEAHAQAAEEGMQLEQAGSPAAAVPEALEMPLGTGTRSLHTQPSAGGIEVLARQLTPLRLLGPGSRLSSRSSSRRGPLLAHVTSTTAMALSPSPVPTLSSSCLGDAAVADSPPPAAWWEAAPGSPAELCLPAGVSAMAAVCASMHEGRWAHSHCSNASAS